jgi:hypothetical protein
MSEIVAGSCLCGGVRFELTQPFRRVSHCHCESCKKLSGGTGTVNGQVASEAIQIVDGRDLLRTYQPVEGSAKTFCSRCGTNLFGGGWPESPFSSVRLPTLAQAPTRKPDLHLFTRSVAPWETLPDDGAARYETRP